MKRFALALAALAAAGALLARAAAPRPEDPPDGPGSLSAGRQAGRGTLVVRARLATGWHVNSHKPSEDYLIATEIKLDPADGVRFGEPRYPEGKLQKFAFSRDAALGLRRRVHDRGPGRMDRAAAPAAVSGSVEYQACNDTQCLAPASRAVPRRAGAASAARPRPAPRAR